MHARSDEIITEPCEKEEYYLKVNHDSCEGDLFSMNRKKTG